MRFFSILVLLLAGCAAGPDYQRPSTPQVEEFRETPGPWKQAQPRDEIARGKWWEIFGDAQLNALVEKIDGSNQTLAAAEAQFRQAQAGITVSRAGLFPTLDGNLSVTRSLSPSGAVGGTTAGRTVTTRNVNLSSSWEPDLWGRVRRGIESSEAAALASAGDLASARLSIQAQLATAYFQLRLLDVQRRLLDDIVAAFRKSHELTNNRYNAGVVARVDVVLADAQVKSTLAQAADLGVQRAQLEHSIAVLTGVPPSVFSLQKLDKFNIEVPVIPPGLPSALLERRPDIAAAERRVAAANAEIGVAKAAYFPQVMLTASYGFRSADAATWLTAPSRFWSIGPSIVQAIFDAGLREARTAQAVAAWEATVAQYRQTTLTAFQEVEDNLAALRVLEEESKLQEEALAAARQSVELTLNQYKAGTVSFLNVVQVQATQLSEERQSVSLLERRLAASVALIRAIGGGWSSGSEPELRKAR